MKSVSLICDVSFLPVRLLKAGDLTCLYESGNLRNICVRDTEIISMIYSAVRDENWNTIGMTISEEVVIEKENRFSITYSAIYQSAGIEYRGRFHIEGNENNSIIFTMDGEALLSFKKNRIGLCVHHPLKECRERPVRITRPDGNLYESVFPALVSPHQPFTEIREMQWTTANGIVVELHFQGETFETEDQRNWSDASYKTYSTPQTIPFPVLINKGDSVHHSITLAMKIPKDSLKYLTGVKREEKIAFPSIGYCRKVCQKLLPQQVVELLRKIPFNHYRVELNIQEAGWEKILITAASEALQLETTLELVCFVNDSNIDFHEFLNQLLPIQELISSILLLNVHQYTTPEQIASPLYREIKNIYPHILTGYGTDGFFAELNRNKPQGLYDFLSFSLNPQVHASDNRSIIGNLESQPDIIETIKAFSANTPIHVSPITLRIRNNKAEALGDELSGMDVDYRQFTMFAAGWSLLCINQLGAARSLTFYELTGRKGLIADDLQPSAFYHLLKEIKAFQPVWIIRQFSNDLLQRTGLLLENAAGERLNFEMKDFEG